jgi:integrase
MQERFENLQQPWDDNGLVFLNTRNKIVQYRNLKEIIQRIYAKAGIEGATMHTLRHTYATRCFEAGVDIKAISEQLGHATVKTTYNIYVHLLEDTKAREIDKLGEIDKFITDGEQEVPGNTVVIPFPGVKTYDLVK